jgi:hypothetical protein
LSPGVQRTWAFCEFARQLHYGARRENKKEEICGVCMRVAVRGPVLGCAGTLLLPAVELRGNLRRKQSRPGATRNDGHYFFKNQYALLPCTSGMDGVHRSSAWDSVPAERLTEGLQTPGGETFGRFSAWSGPLRYAVGMLREDHCRALAQSDITIEEGDSQYPKTMAVSFDSFPRRRGPQSKKACIQTSQT